MRVWEGRTLLPCYGKLDASWDEGIGTMFVRHRSYDPFQISLSFPEQGKDFFNSRELEKLKQQGEASSLKPYCIHLVLSLTGQEEV